MTKTDPKRYLITAALPYANGPVHIGHLAGCYLPADIYVRYLKATGKDVLFICGSDEHGVPITIKAKKEGVTPQEVVDKYHTIMKDAFAGFGIDFTYYGRTSSPVHHDTAQEFFKTLYDKGVFKEEVTQQYYDETAKQFLADRYITGTCPRCGNQNAYGDQCEKCGTSLSPTDLINPKSALSGEKPVRKETKNWFLPMGEIQQSGQFQDYIKRFDNWKSNIKGQCQSWLTEGLQSRAMTRDLDWGVPVPLKDAAGKVLYVWFDAPIGYISATKEYFSSQFTDHGSQPSVNRERITDNTTWTDWWQNEETALIHFIGKDNIVFHAIIFPMMLMTHGKYILPTNIPANEFLNLEGDKISTSRNWAVWLHEYLVDFPNRQDELRYVLTANMPETKDNDFSWKYDGTDKTTDSYQAKINNELISVFGNFINRVIVLTHKFCDGKVPPIPENIDDSRNPFEGNPINIYSMCQDVIDDSLKRFQFREALKSLIGLSRGGNVYLQSTEPWKTAKSQIELTQLDLNFCLQLVAQLGILCEPFLPNTSRKIRKMLNFDKLELKDNLWELTKRGNFSILPIGHPINEAEILFKPVEDEEVQKQLDRLNEIKTANEQNTKPQTPDLEQLKPDITYEDFEKLDLRVGKVLEAEKVPKADKLLKLIVDLGFEKRTILSGIAAYYKPEELVGKTVTVVANLAPRKIRGIESQGMLLMAGNDFGKLYSVGPEKDIEPGSVVK